MQRIKYTTAQKYRAIQMLMLGKAIEFVALKFCCSLRTLWRWKALFDGTKESLQSKSSRPHSAHPCSHTKGEASAIIQILADNPGIRLNELYGKLRVHFAYSRNISSLYRFLKRAGYYDQTSNSKQYIPQEYETPQQIGEKWQMDVKYVPSFCRTGKAKKIKYYQYTVIDEATRERFVYPYTEQSAWATVDFMKRAIIAFGYRPQIVQTDNGREFTPIRGVDKESHALDKFCTDAEIEHKLIRPYTPRHNGKVERSHRNDQQRFYKFLQFDSLLDLRAKMQQYLIRSNSIPSSALRFIRDGRSVLLSPNERRAELLNIKTQKNIL